MNTPRCSTCGTPLRRTRYTELDGFPVHAPCAVCPSPYERHPSDAPELAPLRPRVESQDVRE